MLSVFLYNAAVLAGEDAKSPRSDFFFLTEICDFQRPSNQNNHRLHMTWRHRYCMSLILWRITLGLRFSCPPGTDLNTWIAGSHGFAYSSMRATGNPSAAILLQSKHWIDTPTYAHVSASNATGGRFLASNFMKILKKKMEKFSRSSRLLNIYWKLQKKFANVN